MISPSEAAGVSSQTPTFHNQPQRPSSQTRYVFLTPPQSHSGFLHTRSSRIPFILSFLQPWKAFFIKLATATTSPSSACSLILETSLYLWMTQYCSSVSAQHLFKRIIICPLAETTVSPNSLHSILSGIVSDTLWKMQITVWLTRLLGIITITQFEKLVLSSRYIVYVCYHSMSA